MLVEDGKCENFEKNVERVILRYLQEHPSAKDTVAGIAKWWLSPEIKNISCRQLNKVLDNLVTKGILGKLEINKGELLFFLNNKMSSTEFKKYL